MPTILQPTQTDDNKSTGNLADQFQQLLAESLDGDAMELDTPIIVNIKEKELIVDFQDHGNLVPIHAGYDDTLIPEDDDAYS